MTIDNRDLLEQSVSVAFETSCAVIFHLPLESVSWSRMCVEWSTVADVIPGPLT